ncbi:MAG: hypothetical protein H6Q15_300 [Bacteroidetes bacterium]|nr:hypothetical protein [Bacteroidota bacterium]
MNSLHSDKISDLYNTYNEVIKPLIALYEAREEVFPIPLFNEIRAFNDHIARCFIPSSSDYQIENELFRAERHINRIVLDCYKYLNVSFYVEVKSFESRTKHVDLTVLDNGLFYPKFLELKNNAVKLIRRAKKNESLKLDESFNDYQNAYNVYSELSDLINSRSSEVNWARVRFSVFTLLKVMAWVVGAVLSGLISLFLTCEEVKSIIIKIFY